MTDARSGRSTSSPISIEDQLRLYADSVERDFALHGLEVSPTVADARSAPRLDHPSGDRVPVDGVSADWPDPPDRRVWSRRSIRSRRPLALAGVAAAALVIAGLGVGISSVGDTSGSSLAVEAGDDGTAGSSSIPTSTPAATSTPASIPTSGPSEFVPSPAAAGLQAGRVLADRDRWVVTDHTLFDDRLPGPATTDLSVFRRGEQLFVLDVGLAESGLPAEPTDDAVTMRGNRLVLDWSTGGSRLSLHGFGVSAAELASAARALQQGAGGWELPGAETVLADAPSPEPRPVPAYSFTLAAFDGEMADLTRRVQQGGGAARPATLYRLLIEAADLGPVTFVDVAGTTGLFFDEGGFQYLYAHLDGALISWTTSAHQIDLGELAATVEVVDSATLDAALERGAEIRDAAMAALVAETAGGIELEPIEGGPRLVAPPPWTLGHVRDQSLLTDEERRAVLAEIELSESLSDGRVITVLDHWEQLYARAGEDPRLAPILVTASTTDAGHPPEITVGPGSVPFRFGAFDGFLSEFDFGSMASVRSGDVLVEIIGTGLRPEELAEFAQTLTPLGPTGISGFESSSTAFVVAFEPSTEGGSPDTRSSWTAVWADGDSRVRLSVDPGRSERDVVIGLQGFVRWTVDGRFIIADGAGQPSLSWYDDRIDATVSLLSLGTADIDDLTQLAEGLEVVDWATWTTTVGDAGVPSGLPAGDDDG